MGKETSIAWTEHTFNPWWICTEVSPGCDNCYARTFAKRLGYGWGKGVPRRTFGDAHWDEPLAWNRAAVKAGIRAKVFCASMGDVMDDEAPEGERERLWTLIDNTPGLVWQLLTKRPQRFVRYLPNHGFIHGNVILMATVESQEFYLPRMLALHDARLHLEGLNDIYYGNSKHIPTGMSYEPALGPLSIRDYPALRPDWIIFGGETGAGRRPMQQEWAESIKAECEDAGVAFFMKQFSAATPKKAAALIPAEMLIRQFPAVRR
jgi:protein gp37